MPISDLLYNVLANLLFEQIIVIDIKYTKKRKAENKNINIILSFTTTTITGGNKSGDNIRRRISKLISSALKFYNRRYKRGYTNYNYRR